MERENGDRDHGSLLMLQYFCCLTIVIICPSDAPGWDSLEIFRFLAEMLAISLLMLVGGFDTGD